jgi:ABC-2 type transport system permease protein
MITLINLELYKIFKKWRTYIGFIAIGVLVPVIQAAIYFEGQKYLDFLTQNLQQLFLFTGNFLNGYFIAHLVLGTLIIHIPFLITLVGGDVLAGEATGGTYRLLLTRPVSRTRILTAKFLASILYTVTLVIWLAVMSLGLGLILFGPGELIILKSDLITILSRSDVWWRFVPVYGFAALSMSVVMSLSVLFSSLVENAIGPIVSTMAIIIAFIIITALNIDFFKGLQPYLFTTYMTDWRLLFEDPIDWNEFIHSCLVLAGHIIVFFIATLYIFKRKDILS